MSFVIAAPETVAAAAAEVAGIGSAVNAANAAAAAPTTRLLAAAADEVSAAIAALFSSHAREYQALSAQLAAFHDQFVRTLDAGAAAYAGAEAANAALLERARLDLLTAASAPARPGVPATMTSTLASGAHTALIMGSTGTPHPPMDYMQQVYDRFIAPQYPGYGFTGLYTPAQFQPFTGIPSLTYDESAALGATYLNAAIMDHVAAGDHLVVLGFSQSSSVATLVMRHLNTLPAGVAPSPDQLSFVLLGNPNNPNGGILARFPGLYIQSVGLTFNGATPDTAYPTTVYTTQYDGFADFPQYPINVLADLNALLGIPYAHSLYYELTPEQLASGIVLPVSSPDSDVTYILIPNEHLPLLQPLRGIVPEPVLDLVEPNLRVIVELGYDRTGYADVHTPAGLFPTHLNPVRVAGDLAAGTALGIDNALADLGLPPLPKPPPLPGLPFPTELSSLSLPGVPPPVPDRIPVPPQIGALIDGPLTDLDRWLDTVINRHIDPVITSTIYQAGDQLSAAAKSHGASSDVLNAIVVGQQVLPMLVEGPGLFVTADTHYLVTAIQALADGDLRGFDQNLQLIPATNSALLMFGVTIPAAAAVAVLTGEDFPT
ncbi:PE-PPE domain-containing protein [Mycobacterium shinjukuense]|nr:PE-PPE domain-containing protein [Mycobacterium shinjukuense]MCV6987681.1 PE-PPE domain-containing protein [Mycobacterium shinjukuense]ORB64451.1 PE family protein [Mycobacterium shinjukuense]